MTLRNLSLSILGAGLLLLVTPAAEAEAQKIGVVDMQRALNETEEGRKAKGRLKKLFDKRDDYLCAAATVDNRGSDLFSSPREGFAPMANLC